ncbi:MAG: hypothetical protein HUU08_04080 [Candidatus Brocadia sp.]|nr:hypothetical protein [Candidatus Brocadia sp.]
MKKKSLKETNPYLKDLKKYETALINNVITSSAIEGIHITSANLIKEDLKLFRKIKNPQ